MPNHHGLVTLNVHSADSYAPATAPARDILGVETLLQQNACSIVGALAGTADHMNLAIARQFIEPLPKLTQRDIERPRHAFHRQFQGLAYVQQELLFGFCPVTERQVAFRTSAATMPAKFTGSLALPNAGA